MSSSAPVFKALSPSACTDVQVSDFVELVLAGGEVVAPGLSDRVRAARSLAFCHVDQNLAGVAAMKTPASPYRRRIERSSGVSLDASAFPYELGWVYIRPQYRGRRLSRPLCEVALLSTLEAGAFATARLNNDGMRHVLDRLGFKAQGNIYMGKSKVAIQLFIRNAP